VHWQNYFYSLHSSRQNLIPIERKKASDKKGKKQIKSGDTFPLYEKADDDWLEWEPDVVIDLNPESSAKGK